jgi:branched-chain amino acid transport system permease protein
VVSSTQLLEIVLNGLTIGMVYVLVAAGLSVVFGVMDVLNVSHGELLALGAYFAFSLIAATNSGVLPLPAGSGFWIALVVVPLVVGVVGMGLERFTIRRVYGRGHLAQILLTFGLLLIIYDVKQIVWGKDSKLFSVPGLLDGPVTVFGFQYSLYNYFMIASAAGLAALTWALLQYTRFGLVVRAGSEDRGMVRYLGIDIDRHYTLVFGFGAALAAFGGIVLGGYQNVNLEMGNSVVITAFVVVVLGGLGSFRGAVVGGLGVGILQSFVTTFVPPLQGVLVFLVMIGVLLARPQGLFGTAAGGGGGGSESGEFTSALEGDVFDDRLRYAVGVGAVALLALVPLFQGVLYTKFVVTIMTTVLVWALFAMSLDVILGYAGLVSLGHAMFFGAGAYTVMLSLIHVSPSVVVALALALVVTTALAWVVSRLAIRVSGVYFVMITLAFAELVATTVPKFEFLGGSNGLFGAPEPLYGLGGVGVRLSEVRVGVEPLTVTGDGLFYYFLLAVLVVSYLVVRRVMHAPFGSVLRSIRESQDRARFIGYDVQSFKRRAFVLSGALGGVAGAMFALDNTFVAPANLDWIISGDVIVMSVLGGTGTLFGPMVGAGVFVVLREQLSSLIPWWRLLLGVFFVGVVLFLPGGIVSLPGRIHGLVRGRGGTGPVGEVDPGDAEVDD